MIYEKFFIIIYLKKFFFYDKIKFKFSKISSYDKFNSKKLVKGKRQKISGKNNIKKNLTKIIQKHKKLVDPDVMIANNISMNYNICHHCKQRKPMEVLIKCRSSESENYEAPSKLFIINNTTIYRSKINF